MPDQFCDQFWKVDPKVAYMLFNAFMLGLGIGFIFATFVAHYDNKRNQYRTDKP